MASRLCKLCIALAAAALVVGVAAGAWFMVSVATVPESTGWEFSPGEALPFGNGWGITIPPQWAGRIDVPSRHETGDGGLAYLPIKLHGPDGEEYLVGLEPPDYARRSFAGDKSMERSGAYPELHTVTTRVMGSVVDATIDRDKNGMVFQASVWPSSGDPVSVEVTGDSRLEADLRSRMPIAKAIDAALRRAGIGKQ